MTRLPIVLLALAVLAVACGGEGDAAECSRAVAWDEASLHIGERTAVTGRVVDTEYASSSSGQPTFLNIGRPYPDPDRFTVVIWGDDRSDFPDAPEIHYSDETVCVSGRIETYRGSPQIIADSRDDIVVR